MNWLLIVVLLIFIITAVVGAARGFLKIGLSLGSVVISILLMVMLNPYVTKFIADKTPVYAMIEGAFIERFIPEVSAEELIKTDLTGTPLEGYEVGDIEAMDALDWEQLGISHEQMIKLIGEIPEEVQKEKIEKSILPRIIKNHIAKNNTQEMYEELGVTSFPGYVARYIARMIVTLISFIITFIVVCIIMKALSAVVEIIDIVPGIGWLNHLAGCVAGIIMALLIVWIIFMAITIYSSINNGSVLMDMIKSSSFLRVIYENNIILKELLRF